MRIRRAFYCSILVIPVLACASEASDTDSMNDGGRAALPAGSAGMAPSSGSSGAPGAGGTPQTPEGGRPASTAGSAGEAPRAGSGGASAGASSVGGSTASAGSPASSAGAPSSGGTAGTGGAAAGGSSGAAGAAGGGSPSTGGSGGGGGAGDTEVAKALDELRIDDPCAGTPATTDGATCNHVMLMNNQFKAAKEVTILGAEGTTYDVTLRIRGVVEPTNIEGGMRPDTTTFLYKNAMWRKVPFTIGGTIKQADYQQWRISVASPKQDYFLNDYGAGAHNIFKLDYQVTIPMAANTKVTFDVTDSNERMIDNYEKYSIDGIAGSMNFGQFVQIDVVSVARR